jgi:geranylgeranyl pyrophosphate synthase
MNPDLDWAVWCGERQRRIEDVLARHLPAADRVPIPLCRAMRYAVLDGGKRMRPLLAYAAGELVAAPPDTVDSVAAAVEFVHAYSLIHDDLPCMDDDALRRGKPSCHVAFGEAMALLAGDALQALAFGVLAEAGSAILQRLAHCSQKPPVCAAWRRAGGRPRERGRYPLARRTRKNAPYENGALIRASVRLGAACGRP